MVEHHRTYPLRQLRQIFSCLSAVFESGFGFATAGWAQSPLTILLDVSSVCSEGTHFDCPADSGSRFVRFVLPGLMLYIF